jgi:signal recognition particle receptor subunit beta
MAGRSSWELFEAVATKLLEGSPLGIAIAVIITFGVPILLHFLFYRAVASPPSSNFLLLGPSGAGKTALLTLVCCAPFPISNSRNAGV